MVKLRKKKSKAPPTAHHPGQIPTQLDNNGTLMTPIELIEKRKRDGKCPLCGLTQTHKKPFLGMLKPLTIPNQVYKGKCLKCMSMMQACNELNEPYIHAGTGGRGSIAIPNTSSEQYHPTTAMGDGHMNNQSNGSSGCNVNQRGVGDSGNGQEYYPRDPRAIQGREMCTRPASQQQQYPNPNNNEAVAGAGEYFDQQQQHPNGVPTLVGSASGFRDDVSVISMDQTIMTNDSGGSSNRRNIENEMSLGKITEDNEMNSEKMGRDNFTYKRSASSNGSSSVANNKPGCHSVGGEEAGRYNRLLERKAAAAANMPPPPTSTSPGSSETKWVSSNKDDTTVPTRGAQSVAAEDGGRYNRLLERKLAGGSDARRAGGSSQAPPQAVAPSSPRSPPNNDTMLAARGAHPLDRSEEGRYNRLLERKLAGDTATRGMPSTETNHVHFKDTNNNNDKASPSTRPQPTRDMSARIRDKLASSSSTGHVRSHSEGHALLPSSSTSPSQGHVRSLTSDATTTTTNSDITRNLSRLEDQEEKRRRKIAENDDMMSKRTMSSEEAQDDFHRRYSKKVAFAAKLASSSVDDSTRSADSRPGVQSVVKDDKYISILDRKLAGLDVTNDTHQRDKAHRRQPTTESSMSTECEAQSIVDGCSTCGDLIDVLKRSSDDKPVVLKALRKLRDCLLVSYELVNTEESEDGVSVGSFIDFETQVESETQAKFMNAGLTNSGWAKVMIMVLSANASDVSIQYEILQTLWEIVTLHPRYTSDLMNADTKQIVSTMEAHGREEAIQEYACGLLACLAMSQKHALRLSGMYNGKFIQLLMTALQFQGRRGNVQVNALKGLFLLSSASNSSDPTVYFSNKMGLYAVKDDQWGGDPSVNAITNTLDIMKHHLTNANVQIHGNKLLHSVFNPDAVQDQEVVDILRGLTFQHIEAAMTHHHKSQAFHESAVCLLSKMSCSGRDSRCREAFLRVVVESMKVYKNSSIIALHGCNCLASMCARSETLLDSQPVADSIPLIITLMNTFQDHIAIQSEACSALATLCTFSPSNKERVHHNGGIDAILYAYDSFRALEVTKVRACVALTTLAVDPFTLSDMEAKGVITKFEKLYEEEEQSMSPQLKHAIQGLLALVLDGDNTDRKLVFREDMNEEETIDCLRANLRMIFTPEFTPNRATYLCLNTLRSIKVYPESVSIHENGCKLLACLFDIASDDGTLYSQGGIISEELGIIQELTTSLVQHKNNPEAAAAILSALQNFCILLLMLEVEDYSFTNLATNDDLARCLSIEISILDIYHDNEDVLERVTGAIWALCKLALSDDITNNIGLIVGIINRFSGSDDLHIHCIGILGLFFSVSNDIMSFINAELVTALLRFIEDSADNVDATDMIDTAVNIILVISNKGYTAITTLLSNEQLIPAVVGAMFKFPDRASLQGAAIDILSNIALDNFLRQDVCQRGGTSRIISALDNPKLKQEATVVCKAFAALSNLISGASVEVLQNQDLPAPKIFVQAMVAHPQNLPIQVGGAYALWALSARDDSFKEDIVNSGGITAIAEAMTRYPASRQMQARGFVVMWSCAAGSGVPKFLKVRVGQCGIEPVVNGLSAHITSEKACEDALGCIKCLSTVPQNKELIDDRAVDLIYACMLLHSENSTVAKAALAALCNVSVNVDTNQVTEITKEDLDAIVLVMRAHQDVKVVQESAIILLRNFTFFSSNVELMAETPFLVNLVRSAMAKHNDLFQGRAEEILRCLPDPGQ